MKHVLPLRHIDYEFHRMRDRQDTHMLPRPNVPGSWLDFDRVVTILCLDDEAMVDVEPFEVMVVDITVLVEFDVDGTMREKKSEPDPNTGGGTTTVIGREGSAVIGREYFDPGGKGGITIVIGREGSVVIGREGFDPGPTLGTLD